MGTCCPAQAAGHGSLAGNTPGIETSTPPARKKPPVSDILKPVPCLLIVLCRSFTPERASSDWTAGEIWCCLDAGFSFVPYMVRTPHRYAFLRITGVVPPNFQTTLWTLSSGQGICRKFAFFPASSSYAPKSETFAFSLEVYSPGGETRTGLRSFLVFARGSCDLSPTSAKVIERSR